MKLSSKNFNGKHPTITFEEGVQVIYSINGSYNGRIVSSISHDRIFLYNQLIVFDDNIEYPSEESAYDVDKAFAPTDEWLHISRNLRLMPTGRFVLM